MTSITTLVLTIQFFIHLLSAYGLPEPMKNYATQLAASAIEEVQLSQGTECVSTTQSPTVINLQNNIGTMTQPIQENKSDIVVTLISKTHADPLGNIPYGEYNFIVNVLDSDGSYLQKAVVQMKNGLTLLST